ISRAAFEIASGVLLEASGSRFVVASPHARQVLAFRPEQRSNAAALMDEMSRIARSLRGSRVQQAWALARGHLISLGQPGWGLPSEFAETGSRGVLLFHSMNIKRGFREAVKLARRRYGMKVALYLHDMLPLTHPQYTGGRAREFRAFV